MPFSKLKKCTFVSVPFSRLKRDLEGIIAQGIQPEIGLEGVVLYEERQQDFLFVAERLHEAGLRCTLHAPFFELYPGSLDPYIRRLSRYKLEKAFDLIDIFRPASIVCHLSFEANKHGYKEEEWFKYSLEAWQLFLEFASARKTPFMLENTYEQTPQQLKRVLTALDSPYARFCLDVGHVMAFAKSRWQQWLPEMTPWLGQLHLHDNNGDSDLHLGLGEGIFDFEDFFAYLKNEELHPLVTLEAHHAGGVETGFRFLEKVGFMPKALIPKAI
ncbi:MAG: sugar phosphate isomerase/epimerase [Proteobacteria bacterium]|nr:sugar phosphate isomerase/epimerase [Pseudomonadota bacterium]MBU1640526.1 sugar phosphate isomerase/epimerase [Pseudomonadota bacterium]